MTGARAPAGPEAGRFPLGRCRGCVPFPEAAGMRDTDADDARGADAYAAVAGAHSVLARGGDCPCGGDLRADRERPGRVRETLHSGSPSAAACSAGRSILVFAAISKYD